ncbi:MAG: ABC transporter permease [Clostridiaceae bacterium]
MNLIENFKMAIDSIKSNKMRSFLTMLGIIIGISSVIMIMSIGSGGKNNITEQFEKMGANNLTITVDSTKASNGDYFTLKDIEAIKTKVDTVKYVSPTLSQKGKVSTDIASRNANITGSTEDYSQINNSSIVYGRFFSKDDALNSKSVILIDENSAKALFGYSNVIGKTLKLGNDTSSKNVTIIGVTESQSLGPTRDTASIIMPISFFQNLFTNSNHISSLTITAVTKAEGDLAGKSALNILKSRHNINNDDVYKLENNADRMTQVDSILGLFTSFITAVAGISLVVGGIGVMNIMLVSVTERTREIGIRKSIGATTKTILIQFLTESSIISLIGGIIGMIIGYTGAQLIGLFVGITPSISVIMVIGVILFSSSIGIFFGIYPARKAANLDPIDALRYE